MAMRKKFKAGLGALFAVVALGVAQLASAADVTGTWNMTVETSSGNGTPTLVLVQKGEAITGNYKGQLGEADVSGTIKGDDISLIYKVDAQGQSLTVTYAGKVAGNSMSGKVSLGQFGEGTFKGSKQ
jgi:hypothetical protein